MTVWRIGCFWSALCLLLQLDMMIMTLFTEYLQRMVVALALEEAISSWREAAEKVIPRKH